MAPFRRCAASSGSTSRPRARGRGAWMPSVGSKPLDRSIVEGPLPRAVWMLAWPTMLQNLIGGLQGMVDHALVGHFVGYAANAAIGVAIQIFIVVIVFVISVFSGMGVLVARFAGANDPEKVNRTVYQAFLAAVALWGLLLAPLGWVVAPALLGVVNAAPAVRAEALPFLRIMFVGSLGTLLFFMVGGALRAVGDARTPLRLGILLTVLNIACNVAFITGLGPFPRLGTAGAAVGTAVAGIVVSSVAGYLLFSGRLPVTWHRGMDWRPDWAIIRALFRFADPVVVGLGVQLLGFLSVSGLFVTVALTYTGGLQGTGDTRSPLYISIVSQIVVPLGVCALFQATRGLRPADIWMAILLGHITRCALSVARFCQGRWRSIQVALEPARP